MRLGSELSQDLASQGWTKFAAEEIREALGEDACAEFTQVESTFEALVQDQHMGDQGRYRFRRFNRFRLSQLRSGGFSWELLSDTSIHQLRRDNPLNGGVTRTFEALSPELLSSRFLAALIEHDARLVAEMEPDFLQEPVLLGVHQVRIVATPMEGGKPTPEGVHRDAERYTFQHFWERHQVEGGEFIAYDQDKNETFRWLQTDRLDSLLFCGTTWHSATPIACRPGCERGYRDIFLIDFDPLS